MSVQRGDVVLAYYPFASGVGGKRRPALVVQNDGDNQKLANTVVAQITGNLKRAGDPSHFLIEVGTPAGAQSGLLHDSVVSRDARPGHRAVRVAQSGLLHDSVVSCNNLATIEQNLIDQVIGSLPQALMHPIDACLKAALALP